MDGCKTTISLSVELSVMIEVRRTRKSETWEYRVFVPLFGKAVVRERRGFPSFLEANDAALSLEKFLRGRQVSCYECGAPPDHEYGMSNGARYYYCTACAEEDLHV